ncbi:MAG: PIG-L family deacetylase [Chitinophagaceae bacterium]
MKKFVLLILIFIIFFNGSIFSQTPASWTSADMYLAIRKLNVLGSVLYLAAHPDDENTRLIAYLSKDRMLRTGYLSMTRGDGGQNLIGDEQGIELGLIRTQELLSARRTDGGEQFFTRAYDFGYSKTPEETFEKWNKEKILSDVVWVIRKFQPDVIVTRFPTTGEGGHGHHTASAILANEAFEAAANPNRFPEQLKYVKLWQIKRIMWNTFNFGGTNTTREDQLKIDVGGYNPLLGKSYGEIAAESRSNHKSQGFGSSATRGEQLEYFNSTKGDQPTKDLLDGVNLSWSKVDGGAAIEKMINDITASFDLLHPDKSVESLVKLYKIMSALPIGTWRNQKLKETEELIKQCSGLFLDATTSEQFAVQTDSIKINFSFNNRLGTDAILQKVVIDKYDSSFSKKLELNRNQNFSMTLYVSPDKPITQPYWLANKMEVGYFNVTDQQLIGQPDVSPSFIANVGIRIFGEPFNFTLPVKYKFTDPVRGELYEPLVVLPPVEFNFVNDNNFSINDSAARSQVFFKSNLNDSVLYDVAFKYPDGWFVDRKSFSYGTWKNNSNYVSPYFKPQKKGLNRKDTISLNVAKGKQTIFSGKRNTISYNHIPYIIYFKEASSNLIQIDVKTYNKKIGYIVGAGDKVPEALEQMGYEVTLLTEKEMAKNGLDKLDAIITGVRSYNTNDWMNKYYNKLMKYVEDGGNLIVQYNTSSRVGPVNQKIGPYNFDISRTRVTDENAAVNILKPEHPVLNFPNKITQDDFKGWIQERSIYHASNWDKDKFETIFSMNDAGEKPDEGSLIIAKHGKGYFSYTGIVFFRELPAGVPGAYRLLANLIALNKKKGF